MAINKLSKYHVIVEEMKAKIFGGELQAGELFPSENQLSREYETSRVTVRKALAVLINEGYIFTVQGKGNFVSDPNLHEYQFQLNDEARGIETKLIRIEIVKPETDIRIHMQYFSNNKIVEIKKYLICDGEIIGYALKYMPYRPKAPILEKEFHYINLEETADKFFGETVKIKTESADEEIAEILSVAAGYPLLVLETKTENENEITGYEKTYLIGDKYQIVGE